MNTKDNTLFGGLEINVRLDDGSDKVLKVRQFKIKEYRALVPLLDDEIGLCARACDQSRPVIESLAPASYEAVYAAVKEVNAEGFFPFAQRQVARGVENLRALPPEMLEKFMARGQASSMPSPILPPPVV